MSDAALTRYAIEVIVIVVPGALAYVLRTWSGGLSSGPGSLALCRSGTGVG